MGSLSDRIPSTTQSAIGIGRMGSMSDRILSTTQSAVGIGRNRLLGGETRQARTKVREGAVDQPLSTARRRRERAARRPRGRLGGQRSRVVGEVSPSTLKTIGFECFHLPQGGARSTRIEPRSAVGRAAAGLENLASCDCRLLPTRQLI